MRSALVLVLIGCRFDPGAFANAGDGGVTDDGPGSGGDSKSDDAMVTPARSCTFLLGSDHSCSVRTSDGTVHCVGQNAFGELGRGTAGGTSTTVTQVAVGSTISASSRSYHACIAKSDGTAQCWGYSDSGQIGDGQYITRPSPTTVSVANVVEIVTARSFSCARRSDNSVTCWGANADGQLGDGTFSPQPAPTTTVMGLTQSPVELTAGSSHACARFADGTAACWGRNAYGQLGDNSTTNRNTAVAAPVTGIKTIAPGGYSTGEGVGGQTCALLSAGTVSCWGSNNFGQLGNGNTSSTPSMTPVQVAALTDAVELSMGRYHVCARHGTNGGTVSCWGRNAYGQVGDASMSDRSSPTPVSLPRPAVHVVAGGFHTCALLDDDSVRCWGLNTSGQLADTTSTTRSSPVASSLCP